MEPPQPMALGAGDADGGGRRWGEKAAKREERNRRAVELQGRVSGGEEKLRRQGRFYSTLRPHDLTCAGGCCVSCTEKSNPEHEGARQVSEAMMSKNRL